MNHSKNYIRVLTLLLFTWSLACAAQESMLCVGHYWTEDEAVMNYLGIH